MFLTEIFMYLTHFPPGINQAKISDIFFRIPEDFDHRGFCFSEFPEHFQGFNFDKVALAERRRIMG